MTFDNSEYNALRTELLHHDRSCLTILQFLLTDSTAIYGLVSTTQVGSFLLILLSIIWFIGFLYMVEKRSTIKRITFYIKTQIEDKRISSFGWEKWSFNNRKEPPEMSLPKISPPKIEFALLTITNIVNCTWFWFDTNNKLIDALDNFSMKLVANQSREVLFILLLSILLTSIIYSGRKLC